MPTRKVYLQCVKEKSKLRVKIVSSGYNNNANCQFPRAIRVEGRKYEVPATAIKVVQRGTHKFFYHVDKHSIKIVDTLPDEKVEVNKIYASEECCICLDDECNMVIVPCGHMCLCSDCSGEYNSGRCPMCRGNVSLIIDKDKLS